MKSRKMQGLAAAAAVVALGLCTAEGAWAQSAYKYSMKIVPTIPKGAAAEKLAANYPSNTKFTPCLYDGTTNTKIDAVTFTMTYDAGTGPNARDVFAIIFTPNTQEGVDQYQIGKRTMLTQGGGIVFKAAASLDDLNILATQGGEGDTPYIYMPKELNSSGKVTETLVSSSLVLNGVPKGTWQIVGIIGDRSSLDLKDPSTWDAWDVATVVVGRPWLVGGDVQYDTTSKGDICGAFPISTPSAP